MFCPDTRFNPEPLLTGRTVQQLHGEPPGRVPCQFAVVVVASGFARDERSLEAARLGLPVYPSFRKHSTSGRISGRSISS